MSPLTFCDFEGAQYLFFGPNVAPLVLYSHLPVMLVAFALGAYILWRNWKALQNQLLFVITATFATWVFLDSIFWASNRADVIMFTWATIVLIEPLVHLAGLYLLYVLVEKRDLPFWGKMLLFALYLPLIFFAATRLNLYAFDISSCLALEGPIAKYYSYGLEVLIMIATLIYATMRFDTEKNRGRRREIFTLSAGVLLLMFAFSWGNIMGSFTDEWEIAQYGLFGMPIFIAFLTYTIVRYGTFNIKVVGAVALVLGLCTLNFGLLFVQHVEVFRTVAIATLVLSILFGFMLIRSVNREVRQRELIEKQEKELELANREQESLLHFISHEVKGYLTKSEAGFASIADGSFGPISSELKTMSESALGEMRKGVTTVMDILNASNLKKGSVLYAKKPFDFKATVLTVIEELKPAAEEKHLLFEVAIGGGSFLTTGDEHKLKQHAIRNLIDNAIKYTPKGVIRIELARTDGKFRFSVQDNGVGITPEDMGNLFTEGGHGKDSLKTNIHSTGYGLYIAKKIVEAHGGKIWAESEGQGKGSTFVVELPFSN